MLATTKAGSVELEFTPRFLHAEAHEVPEALELRELGSPQVLLFPKDQ